MEMIPEKVVESAAESVGGQTEEGYGKLMETFGQKQPIVLAYMMSENLNLLTDEERSLLVYLVLVTRKAAMKQFRNEPGPVTEKMIEAAEDANWEKINDITSNDFRKRLDIFFKDTGQEEILAFYEDALMDDEEESITKAGREYIFVAAKTVADFWLSK